MKRLKITEKITTRESKSFKTYLNEISKISLFESPEVEAECAKKAFAGDERAVNELVRRNLRFVISVAKHYENGGIPLEDLVNEGNMGLVEAARRFDPSTGNKFISYAVWYIRKNIIAFLSKDSRTIKLPTNRMNRMMDFNNKVDAIVQKLERNVVLEDLLGNVEGFDDYAIEDLFLMKQHNVTSMDISLDNDFESINLHDIIPSSEYKSTDHIVVENTANKMLDNAFDILDTRAIRVLKMYYGFDGKAPMKLDEIGQELGITREGVRQIKEKGIKKIRARVRHLDANIFLG